MNFNRPRTVSVILSFVIFGSVVVCTSGEGASLSDFPVYQGDTRPGDVWPKPQLSISSSKV